MKPIDTSTLTRLWNQALNPFWGLVPDTPQKAIYRMGVANPPGLEGGWPFWGYAEFDALAAGDTNDAAISLPEDFALIAVMGSSDQESGTPAYNTFAVQLYDVNDQQMLINPPVLNGCYCGTKGRPLFPGLREGTYHRFRGKEPTCFASVTNLAASAAIIQVVLYGIVGGQD